MIESDIVILGAGVAGTFAALKILKDFKNKKVTLIDLGRGPLKRRRQLEGFLGCLPNSDGKFYLNDLDKVKSLIGVKKANNAFQYMLNILKPLFEINTIKDNKISLKLQNQLKKDKFNFEYNDYIQVIPHDIQILAKYCASIFENPNITLSFDNEIFNIVKKKNKFILETEEGEISASKVINCTGRSGWRWNHKVYSNFGIIENNDISSFGIRAELPAQYMKQFNDSNITLKKNNLEIGPLCWNGTVVPEDHLDLTICGFRSNESRWETSKVSFPIIINKECKDKGVEQTERIGKLAFILANDRLSKEKISSILNNKSKVLLIKEYDWLKEIVTDLARLVPELLSKGSFHIPDIVPLPSRIILDKNLESEIDGFFVCGEAAGVRGLLSAAVMGIVAASSACK